MTFAQVLAALGPIAAALEPILLNLEQNSLLPELQALAASATTSPDLKLLLNSLISGIGAFVEAETAKLS